MKKRMPHTPYMILAAIFLAGPVCAQDLNKEVFVVRPYEPTLSDAVKINFQPENKDVKFTAPKFSYTITPRRLDGDFIPDPIKPARTLATSLPKIYNAWLKIGLGNYKTSLAELDISNVRSKDYAFGAYLYHKSSDGNIRLTNDHKVPAGYNDNTVKLYGKRFFSTARLTGDVRFDHRGSDFYGYNTDLFADSIPPIDQDSLRQRTFLAGFDLGVASTHTDSSHLNYSAGLRYDHFWDKPKNKENRFMVELGLNKNIRGLMAGVDLSFDYAHTDASSDTVTNTIVRFSPWISKRTKDWKFLLGFEAVADVEDFTRYYFYPHASLDIVIIEKVLIPFLGVSGELQRNSYMDLVNENRYVVPGLHLKNTSSNLIAYAGLKGSISSAVRFRADVSYKAIKNMHFFFNDTLSRLQNQFIAGYDEVDLITYHGQLVVQPSQSVDISLDGKFFEYSMLEQKKPWHLPDFRVSLDGTYQLGRKFVLGTGVGVIGNRWVKRPYLPEGMVKLKPVADINLKLNYNYSRAFTLFAELYNLADRSYLVWDQYPSQRFNFLFGLSYKL